MIRVRVLKDDPTGRFHVGDEGVLLVNDSEKYDYFVMLDGEEMSIAKILGLKNAPDTQKRLYYFYEGEIERL